MRSMVPDQIGTVPTNPRAEVLFFIKFAFGDQEVELAASDKGPPASSWKNLMMRIAKRSDTHQLVTREVVGRRFTHHLPTGCRITELVFNKYGQQTRQLEWYIIMPPAAKFFVEGRHGRTRLCNKIAFADLLMKL